MIYTAFTDKEVFTDPAINAVMNVVFTDMIAEFTDVEVGTKLALSGSVSKVIQGVLSSDDALSVLPLRTSSEDIFNFFIANGSRWFGVPVMVYPDRCTIAWSRVYVELWLSESALTIEEVDLLLCENHATIPSNIL
jgi:hypothetical protein